MGCTLAERNPSIFKQEIKGRPRINAFWRNPHKKRKKTLSTNSHDCKTVFMIESIKQFTRSAK